MTKQVSRPHLPEEAQTERFSDWGSAPLSLTWVSPSLPGSVLQAWLQNGT